MRRVLGVLLLAAVYFCLPFFVLGRQSPQPASTEFPAATAPAESPAAESTPAARPYRAVWVSYLEWQNVDFSDDAAFGRDIAAMLDNLQALGATVVLAQVRPFGDALYPSRYFPFSHLCTGVQGQDPGFDPLALLAAAAHERGLELEAWVNPYRLQSGGSPALCDQSPGVTHPEWVCRTDNGLYLNPALPEVRQYIADAVAELCENYAVDGIHFDDYFYPATDPAFDKTDYTAAGTGLTLADWRRQNVNELVSLCWQTAHRYGVRFGIAPAGDPAQCAEVQYSDTALWLREPGYVDYLLPQLYWGLQYSKSGDTAHSLARLAAVWDTMPRCAQVQLYAGLGAYRIGTGDGGDIPGEWQTGHALADQLAALPTVGAALYRYGSLFENADFPDLANAEAAAIQKLWR